MGFNYLILKSDFILLPCFFQDGEKIDIASIINDFRVLKAVAVSVATFCITKLLILYKRK